MKNSKSISVDGIKKSTRKLVAFLNLYRVFIFFLIVSALYGFIVWRINVLAVAPPTQAEVQTAQQESSAPRINQSVVDKIMSLKDNSVRVQTLFEEARNNPFSE
jgi:nitrate reductase NapE component